jgi:hypothetical protein
MACNHCIGRFLKSLIAFAFFGKPGFAVGGIDRFQTIPSGTYFARALDDGFRVFENFGNVLIAALRAAQEDGSVSLLPWLSVRKEFSTARQYFIESLSQLNEDKKR